jgi:hypothetical protein
MAYVDHKGFIDSRRVASVVAPQNVVALIGTVAEAKVAPIATNGVEPYGVVDTAQAIDGNVTVYAQDNIVKAIAGASLGPGADVGVASSNGALAPVAGASGVTRWRTGKALEAAAVGERFSILVSPRQLSNLI